MPNTARCCRAAGTTTSGIRFEFAHQSVLLPDPVAADRRAAVHAAAQRRTSRRPRHKPTPSTGASSPGSPLVRSATVLAMRRGQRARHGADVGLSALAIPRLVAGAERAPPARSGAAGAHCRHLGDRVRLFGARFLRQLRRAAALRPPLPRGVLPGRQPRPRDLAALSGGDRQTAGLCDRHHVGRRQCRALRAEPAARAGRRQAASARHGSILPISSGKARWWCGRPAICANCRSSCGRSPPEPTCNRRCFCITGAGDSSLYAGWAILKAKR